MSTILRPHPSLTVFHPETPDAKLPFSDLKSGIFPPDKEIVAR
jgi:hypothetical protein